MALIFPPETVNVWQSPFELRRVLELFTALAPKHIAELGSADGGTIWCWAHNCVPGAHILSVDWYKPDCGYPDNRHLYGHWAIRNTCRIDWVAGDTREQPTINRVKEFAPFDWLYIDAGHALKEVTNDWEQFSPMVRKGGVVLFHDITPRIRPEQVEVRLLWDQLKHTHAHMEIIENVNDDKLGTGVLWV